MSEHSGEQKEEIVKDALNILKKEAILFYVLEEGVLHEEFNENDFANNCICLITDEVQIFFKKHQHVKFWNKKQRKAIPALIKKEFLKNKQIIMDINSMQKQKQAAAEDLYEYLMKNTEMLEDLLRKLSPISISDANSTQMHIEAQKEAINIIEFNKKGEFDADTIFNNK